VGRQAAGSRLAGSLVFKRITMEPQSPVTVPKRKVHSFEFDSILWWKQSGVWIVGIFVVIGFIIYQQPGRGGRRKASHTEVVNNARQIGMALSEFQKEYGEMPNENTVVQVRQKTGKDLRLKLRSSNEYFRQLLASGTARNESVFYAQVSGNHKPDNVFTGATALAKGECGFTYLLGAPERCNPSRPILVAPMIPGTDRFDPKPFDGKALVLRMDNTAFLIPIAIKTGKVMKGRLNLMDPTNPIWEGKPPTIAWPDL
jgi:hypothetical protein